MDFHTAYPDVFTQADAAVLASLQHEMVVERPKHRIVRANVPLHACFFLQRGFVGRYRSDRLGRRQFLGLQIAGDFVDLPSYVLGHLDHDLDAITEVNHASVPHAEIRALHDADRALFEKLWRISLMDAAIHRYWIFRVGRLTGRGRIANFFCEMLVRQYARGLCTMERFELPVTQTDLAEICGMTPVHANRLVGELREEGICTFGGGAVTVTDLPEMFRTGQFAWDYLYLPSGIDAALRQRLAPEASRGAASGGANRGMR